MKDLTDSIIAPMLNSPLADSAKEITRADHVKEPSLVTEEELLALTRLTNPSIDPWCDVAIPRATLLSLIVTVRALQVELAVARDNLVNARQLLKEMS